MPPDVLVLSMLMPRSSPIERIALPATLLISFWRNDERALFIVNWLVLPSVRYMPEASMVTATLLRPSVVSVLSWSLMVMSLGASIMNSRPRLLSVWVSLTPQSKSTARLLLPSLTVVLTLSVAVMCSCGFMGSPVNSM